MSDWSKPVSTGHEQALRARVLIAQGHSPAHEGPWPETEVYLEVQNVSGAVGAPTRFYFDPEHGWKCEVRNGNGKLLSPGGPGSGGGPEACWITLPYDSTIRLRANMYGYGAGKGDGLVLMLFPPQSWFIKAGDTNDYFLSGTFTVTTPANFAPKDFEAARAVWSGTLKLPKLKLPVQRP